MSKRKGTLYERELFHLFWKNNWAAVRSAGSGSTPLPAPDILAGNRDKLLAIECKAIKNKSHHFNKKEIDELKLFSNIFGATAIIGMRFNGKGWYFLDVNSLIPNKNGNFTISLNLSEKTGIRFDKLIEK
jgi:Holliday junction resolvase|tara:strand:- start:4390 stop:4779 length:390 start_codon:yes stop_codon:yes gene_type:complete